MDNTLHIAICVDNNYVYPAKVLISSILSSNTENSIHMHIVFGSDISTENKEILQKALLPSQIPHSFYKANGSTIKDLPVKQDGQPLHISSSAYYRLFLAELLPCNIDKVLYLDVDMIVRNELSQLWDTDISNFAIGAVPDMDEGNLNIYRRLKYSPKLGYFNSGVLLINLRYWREHNLVDQYLKFWQTYPERVVYHDQDILNYTLRNNKLILPIKYNVQTAALYKSVNISWEYDEQLDEALKSPIIIHYTTGNKPWVTGCDHPWKSQWTKYANKPLPAQLKRKQNPKKKSLYTILRNWMIRIGILESGQSFRKDVVHLDN